MPEPRELFPVQFFGSSMDAVKIDMDLSPHVEKVQPVEAGQPEPVHDPAKPPSGPVKTPVPAPDAEPIPSPSPERASGITGNNPPPRTADDDNPVQGGFVEPGTSESGVTGMNPDMAGTAKPAGPPESAGPPEDLLDPH